MNSGENYSQIPSSVNKNHYLADKFLML